jgi:hypothetical protein
MLCCPTQPAAILCSAGPSGSFRWALLASTPFIGTGPNNFSHIFQESIFAGLHGRETLCRGFGQPLPHCAPLAASIRANRCPNFRQPSVPFCFNRANPDAGVRRKKIGGRGSTLCRHRL